MITFTAPILKEKGVLSFGRVWIRAKLPDSVAALLRGPHPK